MLNNNTSMLTQSEYTTPSTYSIFESPSVSPPSITPGQHKVLRFAPSSDSFTTPTNIRGPNKTRTITLSCINIPNKDEHTRVLYLNNTEVEYIPDTGAAISVISEETAKRAGLNINPYDKNKVRVITADGKEVQDVPGYVETDVTLGEHRLKGVRMLVFKRATNPCLIGRDVLAVHPGTKDHYQAMVGVTRPNKLPLKQSHNIDNNNNEEAESKSIECKDNNNSRLPFKTKIENSVERRCTTKSSIESTYDCSRDHGKRSTDQRHRLSNNTSIITIGRDHSNQSHRRSRGRN